MITESIRQHIQRLGRTEPFTTKEFLSYGTRSAIDQTLSRLVKSGFICRLAPGVFARELSKEFTPLEIRTAKLKSKIVKALAKFETQASEQQEDQHSLDLQACVSEFRRLSTNIQSLISQAS